MATLTRLGIDEYVYMDDRGLILHGSREGIKAYLLHLGLESVDVLLGELETGSAAENVQLPLIPGYPVDEALP